MSCWSCVLVLWDFFGYFVCLVFCFLNNFYKCPQFCKSKRYPLNNWQPDLKELYKPWQFQSG